MTLRCTVVHAGKFLQVALQREKCMVWRYYFIIIVCFTSSEADKDVGNFLQISFKTLSCLWLFSNTYAIQTTLVRVQETSLQQASLVISTPRNSRAAHPTNTLLKGWGEAFGKHLASLKTRAESYQSLVVLFSAYFQRQDKSSCMSFSELSLRGFCFPCTMKQEQTELIEVYICGSSLQAWRGNENYSSSCLFR